MPGSLSRAAGKHPSYVHRAGLPAFAIRCRFGSHSPFQLTFRKMSIEILRPADMQPANAVGLVEQIAELVRIFPARNAQLDAVPLMPGIFCHVHNNLDHSHTPFCPFIGTYFPLT